MISPAEGFLHFPTSGHRQRPRNWHSAAPFATPRSAGETTGFNSSEQRVLHPSSGRHAEHTHPTHTSRVGSCHTPGSRDEGRSSISRHKARRGGFGTSARIAVDRSSKSKLRAGTGRSEAPTTNNQAYSWIQPRRRPHEYTMKTQISPSRGTRTRTTTS